MNEVWKMMYHCLDRKARQREKWSMILLISLLFGTVVMGMGLFFHSKPKKSPSSLLSEDDDDFLEELD